MLFYTIACANQGMHASTLGKSRDANPAIRVDLHPVAPEEQNAQIPLPPSALRALAARSEMVSSLVSARSRPYKGNVYGSEGSEVFRQQLDEISLLVHLLKESSIFPSILFKPRMAVPRRPRRSDCAKMTQIEGIQQLILNWLRRIRALPERANCLLVGN